MRLLLALLLLASIIGSARAENLVGSCMDHDSYVLLLARKYNEELFAHGLVGKDDLLEIYTSKDGTWTALDISTSGLTCMLGAGTAWDTAPQQDPKKGTD